MSDEDLTTKECAEILEVSVERVRILFRQHLLAFRREGGRIWVRRSDLDDFLARRNAYRGRVPTGKRALIERLPGHNEPSRTYIISWHRTTIVEGETKIRAQSRDDAIEAFRANPPAEATDLVNQWDSGIVIRGSRRLSREDRSRNTEGKNER